MMKERSIHDRDNTMRENTTLIIKGGDYASKNNSQTSRKAARKSTPAPEKNCGDGNCESKKTEAIMEKFWNVLKLELKAYMQRACDTEIKPLDNEFLITRKYIGRIHTRALSIKAVKSAPHHMDVEEIWYGYDATGVPWSGRVVSARYDLTGMNTNRAAQMLVHWMRKDFIHTEFFK